MPSPNIIKRMVGALSSLLVQRGAPSREAGEAIERMPESEAVYRGSMPSRVDTQWSTSTGYFGANSVLNRWRLTKMRDRARDLVRNNALAGGMVSRSVENVVGHGFKAQAATDDEDFNKRAEELFTPWFANCDVRGLAPGAEFERLLYRARTVDGDVGVAMVQRGKDYRLQIVEGDLIDTEFGGYDLEKNILDGIQFDSYGKPINFSLLTVEPNGERKSMMIPARNFIFMPRLVSARIARGEPPLAPAFKLFDQIDGIIEAVAVAVRVAACQALAVEKSNAGASFGTLPTALNSQGQNQKIANIEPGMIWYLNQGETVKGISPTQPQQHFPDFIAALLRFAGVTLGLPLELVLLDFSRTNYSSARAALLQAYRTFRSEQQTMIDTFHSRVYRWRISKFVKDGLLQVPDAIANSYWKHKWITPGWAWVDPVKEIQAALMEVDGGLNTLTNIAASHGLDLAQLVAQRKRELDLLLKNDIPTSRSSLTRDPIVNPGATAKPGSAADDDEKDVADQDSDEETSGDTED